MLHCLISFCMIHILEGRRRLLPGRERGDLFFMKYINLYLPSQEKRFPQGKIVDQKAGYGALTKVIYAVPDLYSFLCLLSSSSLAYSNVSSETYE
ncbi:hypothetical protein BRARA_A01945 [Brassica rapa]|uniref:Uncharacterized protein n=1 Tax=Brassica campestris TaxID=3711 RepID=A0A398AV12_BRACM|nr:hypothetical protein BRARA_A01945 [Brassica rapa]